MERSSGRGHLGYQVIGVFKLVGAALCLAVGIGMFRLLKRDVAEELEHFVSLLRLDPGNHFLHTAISRVAGIDRRHLKEIGFGTFFYAALYLIEGIGLILQRPWASYLTVVATGSLVPLEGYAVVRKPNLIRIIVLVLNVAIVIYLIYQLWQDRRNPARAPDPSTPPARDRLP